jgi:hypothetical protein
MKHPMYMGVYNAPRAGECLSYTSDCSWIVIKPPTFLVPANMSLFDMPTGNKKKNQYLKKKQLLFPP